MSSCSSISFDSSSCGSEGWYIARWDAEFGCMVAVGSEPLHCGNGYEPVPCDPDEMASRFGEGFTGASGQCYIMCCVPAADPGSNP